MAKGLRASSRKKNGQALVARLYGPAADARAERLSAKLQELAAKPRPEQERVMEIDEPESKKEIPALDAEDNVQMDVDSLGMKIKSGKRSGNKQTLGRTQKKIAKRKSKKSVVFPDLKAKWRRQTAQKKKP